MAATDDSAHRDQPPGNLSVVRPDGASGYETFIRITADGAVYAYNGHVDLGTGIRTALGQIVAEELDVSFARVVVVLGDTMHVPNQGPTIASETIQISAVPLRKAAAQARQFLLARAAERDGVRLALVAAMQFLPARQRAVLVLRDVLQFSAAEVAGQLETSTAAVNSALQRARTAIAAAAPQESAVLTPDDRAVRETIERYIRAFESADVDALVTLLTDDAILEMPPVPLWYAGRVNYGRFIARVFAMRGGGWRMIPARANGQPALAAYCPDDTGTLRLHTLQVLTLTTGGIARNVVFQDPRVFETFRLAKVIEPGR